MRLSFLRSISPLRAYRDLRAFLATRQRHELWFMIASLAITFIIVVMFFLDSNMSMPYRAPDIIYVQQWPANRTDAEIIAQQKIDGPKEKAAKDAQAQAEAASREQFRKINNQLDAWGL
jgi:predicted lipid-binding transport protein (Tim44 family)